jgi:hypothetical protein
MGLAGLWGRWNSLKPLSAELVAAEISSLEKKNFFCKKGFEKYFPTDGAKLLEHSFPRMTCRVLIRWFVGLLMMVSTVMMVFGLT